MIKYLWLDVPCPKCLARAGQFCVDVEDRVAPHDERLRVFQAALDLKNELEK